MNDAALAETGVSRAMADQVAVLAEQAKRAGISGVVASPKEAARLREILGPDATSSRRACALRAAIAAIRAAWPRLPSVRQRCVAHRHRRPITQAADPAAAFESIAAEL